MIAATAADDLFSTLYADLHRMARRELAKRGGGLTLDATSLLHEAYLDVSGREAAAFPDRHRFMAYACRVMRGIIIDYARRRHAQKRGGLVEMTSINTDVIDAVADTEELSRVSDALDELATIDPRLAQVVDLKFFCGFSFAEIAAMQSVSERTVQRDWEKARIYLHHVLAACPEPGRGACPEPGRGACPEPGRGEAPAMSGFGAPSRSH